MTTDFIKFTCVFGTVIAKGAAATSIATPIGIALAATTLVAGCAYSVKLLKAN